MKISELIERLEALKAEYGDLLVSAYDHSRDYRGGDPVVWDVEAELGSNLGDLYVVIW